MMRRFERLLIGALVVMMSFVLIVSVADLAWLIVRDVLSPPLVLLGVDELLGVFDLFLLVLIGLELLETLLVHSEGGERRVEVIILVGIIALARKVITLDIKSLSGTSVLGLAALLVALALALVVVRFSRHAAARPEEE